jgi:lipoprotein-anchoring transpeptidase ErfK/SrfK
MAQSLLLNVIRRPSDGNVWKGDVKSQCGVGCARRARGFRLRHPNGPFGPGAVGISAFSTVLTGWTQGGPIAIHGTNEPGSIGHAVSNGRIRLPNTVLRRPFAEAVAGTPVLIRE